MRMIKLWWKFKGKYILSDIRSGIKNVVRWFPVIWKDRDWDDHYIWAMMIKKLEFQAKYTRERGHHLDHIRDAQRMELCVRLMKLVGEEKYQTEYQDYEHSEILFLDSESHPGFYEMKSNLIWETFDEYFAKYPKAYKHVMMQYGYGRDTEKYAIALRMGNYMHNKAKKLLFKIMEEYIQTWWD